MSISRDIYDSLMNEPERWRSGSCTIRRDDGVEVWSSMGLFFCSLYRPSEVAFPLFWKIRIWRAISTIGSRMNLSDLLEKSG